MPGKRFDLRITHGAYKNCRARLLGTSKNLPNRALVELRNGPTFDNARLTFDFPWDWLERIPNKSTRPHESIFPQATKENAQ